jgi:putative spermidine/putrescine transport system permease protein
MISSRPARVGLRLATIATMVFIYLPLAVIFLYAFNASRIQSWPIDSLTLDWFARALDNRGAREALVTSVQAGIGATLVALVLGTAAAFAVFRHRFFGRETISFLVILPIALPGVVTGLALNGTFTQVLGVDLGLMTIVVGHATFCIVLVYNNAIARLRRSSRSLEEASADLGADSFQTFRHVTLPVLRTALIAGALLAFALSFDEVIVTNLTAGQEFTLPVWIYRSLSRPNNAPIVNAVAVVAVLLSVIPVYIAQRIAGSERSGIR